MNIRINTIRDLKAAIANLNLGELHSSASSGTSPGEVELQELRFADGDVLTLVVTQKKFGDVVTLVKVPSN